MKFKKAMACILSASTVCFSLAGCGNAAKQDADAVYESAADSELLDVVSHVVNTGSSDAKKEETVYVKTDASGAVDSVIVSDWLKNTDNTAQLEDYTQLTDIKNVKGKEEFSEDNGKLIWESEGNDIYYQGTIDKQLPVDVSISYELDGQPIAAQELAGQSGHVTITIDYKNNVTNQVLIGDKEETIYTPFAAVSGMMLDSAKFCNVEVSNGTVISDGKRDIVVGMAFPGLIDSLNGQKADDELLTKIEDQLAIPSNVVVEADVTDYESGMILTMVNSDIANSLGLDAFDSGVDFSELNDKMDEFSDAGSKLEEGSGKLRDGAKQLSDGTAGLVDGTARLHSGVLAYTDGVGKVADGAVALDDGAAKLESGAVELQDGIGTLDQGVGTLKAGIDSANTGAGALKDGAAQVDDGAKALSAGAAGVCDGVNSLVGNMQTIAVGVGTASTAAAQISGGIDQIVLATSAQTDPSEIDASAVLALVSANLDALGLSDLQRAGVEQIIAGAVQQAAANAANTAKSSVNSAIVNNGLQAGAQQLAASLGGSYATLSSEETSNQLVALQNGAKAVADGASQLSDGTGTLRTGAQQLYDGTTQLVAGASQLKDGSAKLSEGAKSLKDGTSQLKSGTFSLVAGTGELRANSPALIDGSKQLADGSNTLVAGVKQLYDGTIELNDGMVKFNKEGVEKLTSVFDSDYNSISDRVKAISDAGKAYTSFGGASDTENSAVKFIIESAEIKAE